MFKAELLPILRSEGGGRMSMLSSQCSELREKAKLLRMHADGLSAPYIVPSTKELMAITMLDSSGRMEDAADTIESLRDRLQTDVLGSGTCKLEETESYSSERGIVYVLECSNCGQECEHVNGDYEYCPHCLAKNELF